MAKYKQDEINELANQLANRSFSYNQEEDPLYQAYAKQYKEQGNQAMQDTLAQVSARTGGLASSYATQAAQQTYQGYLNQLNDKSLDLYQLALSKYNNETSNLQNQLSMYQTIGNTEYSRDRDAIADERYAEELAYQRSQDALTRKEKNDATNLEYLLSIAQATGDPTAYEKYFSNLTTDKDLITKATEIVTNSKYRTGVDKNGNTLLTESDFYKMPEINRNYKSYQDYVNKNQGSNYYQTKSTATDTQVDYQTINEKMSEAYTEALKEYKDQKNEDGTYPNEFYAYIENAGLGAGATQDQIDKWMESRGL